jgi:hypothetical protein
MTAAEKAAGMAPDSGAEDDSDDGGSGGGGGGGGDSGGDSGGGGGGGGGGNGGGGNGGGSGGGSGQYQPLTAEEEQLPLTHTDRKAMWADKNKDKFACQKKSSGNHHFNVNMHLTKPIEELVDIYENVLGEPWRAKSHKEIAARLINMEVKARPCFSPRP